MLQKLHQTFQTQKYYSQDIYQNVIEIVFIIEQEHSLIFIVIYI